IEECNHIKHPRLSTGCRQFLIATIARIENTKIFQLEKRFLHFGSDYTSTAFENRILIGAIINADYIEQRRFLEISSARASEDTIERHNFIKVNCIKVNMIFNDTIDTTV
ncbi:hypothetical protein ALC53_10170, partial [Atta colombica]